MKPRSRDRKRTKVLSTRLTQAEYERITAAAVEQQISDSDWLRLVATAQVTANPDMRVLAEEILAVRIIVQNIVGYLVRAEPITREVLENICSIADRAKKDRASSLLALARAIQGATDNVSR